MTLKRWITDGTFYPGDEVCELVVDGKPEIVRWDTERSDDIAGTVWAYVREGDEVGPDGNLLEFSTSGGGRDPRNTFIGDGDIRKQIVGGETPNPSSLASPSRADTEGLRETVNELKAEQAIRRLRDRVSPDAHALLSRSAEFRSRFLEDAGWDAFVMSVDIRRSTELMLKARTPEHFASFTTALCREMIKIIVESYGVFDKFTGDGILAFFPSFYSGRDAAYRVVVAADQCHRAFERQYLEFRRSFKAILKDTGLGIGVDYGAVRIVMMADGLTVVGEPVVYACRFSTGPTGTTLLNQRAHELVSTYGSYCQLDETELKIKHDEHLVAYAVKLSNDVSYTPAPPDWLEPPEIQPETPEE